MSTTQLSSARHSADFIGDQLTIRIPSRKNWLQIPFLLFRLIFWFFAWILTATTLFTAPFEAGFFMIFLLIGWTIGGLFTANILLWILFGEEQITVSYDLFSVRRQILGIGHTKSYEMVAVKALRVGQYPLPKSVWNGRRHQNVSTVWKMDGPITFDYGAKTHRLGDGVDEAEAKQIVKIMQQHFPKLS